jgi:hypothetical protein
MGAQPESRDTHGDLRGPATPQHEQESRVTPHKGAVKVLTERFDAVDVGRCDAADHIGGASASSSKSTATLENDKPSMSGAVDRSGGGAQSAHDLEEPILQENHDRFCLLPVKYVLILLIFSDKSNFAEKSPSAIDPL